MVYTCKVIYLVKLAINNARTFHNPVEKNMSVFLQKVYTYIMSRMKGRTFLAHAIRICTRSERCFWHLGAPHTKTCHSCSYMQLLCSMKQKKSAHMNKQTKQAKIRN